MNFDATGGVSGYNEKEVVGVTARTAGTGLLRALTATVLLLPLLAACDSLRNVTPTPSSSAGGNVSAPAHVDGQAETIQVTVDKRPFSLHIPASYSSSKAAPLVILLHGYTATGQGQESYLKFTPESDKRGFLYAYPDGLVDTRGNQYWNATDACCDLYGGKPDDSTYLSDIIKNLKSSYNVDAKRVYLVGHSNGAFMDYRMACDHADEITAIAPLNGAMWNDLSKCTPANPVTVLDIRSTTDEVINYNGSQILGHVYPSAAKTEADWLAFDKCGKAETKLPALDLDGGLPGAETSVVDHTGCAGGSTVEVWTIKGGKHIPPFNGTYAAHVMDFLYTQVKP